MHAGLLWGPDAFTLHFIRAEIIDRKPPPGPAPVNWHISIGPVRVTHTPAPKCPPAYPEPPRQGLSRTPDVESVYQRYLGHLDGREPLPAMAYFCLTMLKLMGSGSEQAASRKFGISKGVLSEVRTLSSRKGGPVARKADAGNSPYSLEEERFLKTAVRKMILHAADVECDPGVAQNQITSADVREETGLRSAKLAGTCSQCQRPAPG